MRERPCGHAAMPALLLVLLAACGDPLENVPPRPAAIEDPAVAEAAFPSLAEVPARPRLSYTLEQRREIVQGLVADRANARHAGDTLRRETGRPVQPDTTPPLPPAPAPVASPPSDPAGDLALAYAEEALARDSDDGSLGDFLDRLQQPPPGVAASPPPRVAVPAAPAEDAPAAPAAAPVSEAAAEPGPVVADADVVPAAPVAVADAMPAAPVVELTLSPPEPPAPDETVVAALPEASPAMLDAASAAPALPLTIPFAPDRPDIGGDDLDELRRVARQMAAGEAVVVVSGGGRRAGLAMERARRVAVALVGAGLPPARIAIEMGGESDVVVVYEAGA